MYFFLLAPLKKNGCYLFSNESLPSDTGLILNSHSNTCQMIFDGMHMDLMYYNYFVLLYILFVVSRQSGYTSYLYIIL